jgi:uncharacterized membrane protein
MAKTDSLREAELQARKPIPSKYFNEDTSFHPASVLISKPIEEVWSFLRDMRNMPKFIRGLASVQVLDDKRSHWVFEHQGERHENDSEIIAEEMGSLLVWQAVGEKNQVGAVSLERAPGGRGTFVSMRTSTDREKGKVTGVLAWYFGGDPKSASYINLRRLKAFMETGEVPTVEGQPNGREQELKH